MDGRDIGTVVFPMAELKIFLEADQNIRVQRRFDELISKGGWFAGFASAAHENETAKPESGMEEPVEEEDNEEDAESDS